jgi:pentatricopeptide repeat protein
MNTETEASSSRKRSADEVSTTAAAKEEEEEPPTANPQQCNKKVKKKHMDPNMLEFRGIVQKCCKTNDLVTAIEGYERAVAAKTRVEPQSFYNLLNLCDGIERGVHIGTPKPQPNDETTESADSTIVDASTRKRYAEKIKKHMDTLKLPLTENACTALIRLFSKTEDFDEAESLLVESESIEQCRPKLRMYSSLLCKYCELGRTLDALKVWLRLSKQELVLSEKEYAALIKCSTIAGEAIGTERVISELAEDVLVPSRETCKAIVGWFESPHASATKQETVKSLVYIEAILTEIKAPYGQQMANLGPVVEPNGCGWYVSHDVRVDCKTGALMDGCFKGARLQPVATSPEAWKEMKEMNESIGMYSAVFFYILLELCTGLWVSLTHTRMLLIVSIEWQSRRRQFQLSRRTQGTQTECQFRPNGGTTRSLAW